jgi:putative ABC transport system substrate-binding protein
MRRRDFIILLGATAVWPLAARAQPAAPQLIGVLMSQTLGPYADQLAGFHRGLRQGGFVEGGNLAVEYRWAEGHDERLPALAADLVRRKVKVIAGLDSTTCAPPRPRPRRSRSSLRSAGTRSEIAWSKASAVPAATSPA